MKKCFSKSCSKRTKTREGVGSKMKKWKKISIYFENIWENSPTPKPPTPSPCEYVEWSTQFWWPELIWFDGQVTRFCQLGLIGFSDCIWHFLLLREGVKTSRGGEAKQLIQPKGEGDQEDIDKNSPQKSKNRQKILIFRVGQSDMPYFRRIQAIDH